MIFPSLITLLAATGANAASTSNIVQALRNHSRETDRELFQQSAWLLIPASGLVSLGCYETPSESVGVNRYFDNDAHTSTTATEHCGDLCNVDPFLMVSKITDDEWKCQCFADYPSPRVSFSDCPTSAEGLDLYFRAKGMSSHESCTTMTKAIQSRLANNGENDAPQGFDMILGEFTPYSPFELIPNGCGTNVYDINTATMSNTDTLKTEMTSVSEYSKTTKSSIEKSTSASASVGGSILGVGVKTTVSASSNSQLNKVLNSNEAKSDAAQLSKTYAVHRTSMVQIKQFDTKTHFITFSQPFYTFLMQYVASGFDEKVGRGILNDYGMQFTTSVMYGGSFESHTALNKTSVLWGGGSQEMARECYELGAEVEAEKFGFTASTSFEESKCTQQNVDVMHSKSVSYLNYASREFIEGGYKAPDGFHVDAETAVLITDSKKYLGAKEDTMQLRFITELFDIKKLSPMMFQYNGLSEDDFGKIQESLGKLIRKVIDTVYYKLGNATNCKYGAPFLKTYDLLGDVYEADCYQGEDPNCLHGEWDNDHPGEPEAYTCCNINCKGSCGKSVSACNWLDSVMMDECCLHNILANERPCSKFPAPCYNDRII